MQRKMILAHLPAPRRSSCRLDSLEGREAATKRAGDDENASPVDYMGVFQQGKHMHASRGEKHLCHQSKLLQPPLQGCFLHMYTVIYHELKSNIGRNLRAVYRRAPALYPTSSTEKRCRIQRKLLVDCVTYMRQSLFFFASSV